tara:strand:- start:1073 stop:2569 length:1497 start_codon:yes stop_codon:yes gene_type:complete
MPLVPTVHLSATFAPGTPIDVDIPSSAPIEAGIVLVTRITILEIDDLSKLTVLGAVRAKCNALLDAKYTGAIVHYGGTLVCWASCEKAAYAAEHCRSKGATSIAYTGVSPPEVKALFTQDRVGATLLSHNIVHVCGMLTEGANLPELGLTWFGDDRKTMPWSGQFMPRSGRAALGKMCADTGIFLTERGEIDTAAIAKEMRGTGDASLFASSDVSEEKKLEKLLVDRRVRVVSRAMRRRIHSGLTASDDAEDDDPFVNTTYRVVLSSIVKDLGGGGLVWPSLEEVETYLFSIDQLPPVDKLVLIAEGKRPMHIRLWWNNRVKYFIAGAVPPSNIPLPTDFVDRIKSERPPFFVKWEGKRPSAPTTSADEIGFHICSLTKEKFDAFLKSKEPVSVKEVTRPVPNYLLTVSQIISVNWTGTIKDKCFKLSSVCKEALEEKDFFMARVAAGKARSEKVLATKKRKAEEVAASSAAASSSSAAPAPASGGSKKKKKVAASSM